VETAAYQRNRGKDLGYGGGLFTCGNYSQFEVLKSRDRCKYGMSGDNSPISYSRCSSEPTLRTDRSISELAGKMSVSYSCLQFTLLD
jgi:hypothetical protein